MTKLEKTIKRSVTIGEHDYTLVIDPTGLRLTEKGKRNGVKLAWADIVSGDAALAVALRASA